MKLQEPNVGGSEMASREKKPLVPSKAKQKANNDCSLPSNEIKSRKGKSLSNLKQQQLARDILEAVATGSQLPPKLEASLPRKKVLRNLKHKQKLKVAKANLIKSKVTRKVASRNLCRIPSDIKKSVRTKRIKLSEENSTKTSSNKSLEHQINETEGENIGAEGNRSAKNNLRTKKTKFILKNIGEVESEDILDRDSDSVAGCSTKSSPKLNRKGRSLESLDSLPRGVKSTKFSGFKRNSIKEKDTLIKAEVDIKYSKGRKATRDIDYSNTRVSKSLLDSKSSIDLTIDEVIASMLSDTEIDNQQGITEKIEGKLTRSKKMLVEENIISDIEIKKEPDSEDIKITSDGENFETESVQNAIHLRKRSNANIINQRSLRNGKLRQSDSVISDLELKKRRRLNSDDPINSEVSADNIADNNIDSESSFSESSGNDSQTIIAPVKDEMCMKQETLKNFEDNSQIGSEVENNNNSDRADRTSEIGPTLRSKTKAKSTEVEIKSDNIKIEYTRIIPKNMEVQEELKKMGNLEQVRKDNILAKLSDKSKGRRSSLNIDMKKTVNSFYNTDKSDGNPKSQIDQMIENIKLTIAKSIESKIFGPEKGLGLNKNFEIPKIEEIIAPLSAESQKLGLEENTDEDKSAATKNEMKSDNSDNSIPKVADTAKEIEKLVMGDIELAETHSQNVQESESSDADSNTPNVSEVVNIIENESGCKIVIQEGESNETSNLREEAEKNMEMDDQIKILDDGKKVMSIRKSSRIIDKASPESNDNTVKKLGKVMNKVAHKSENCEESLQECDKSISKETISSKEFKNESTENKTTSSEFPVDSTITESKKEEIETEDEKTDTTRIEDGAKISTSTGSDDVETLERISKEVERMVAEDESGHRLKTSADEQNDEESATSKTATESSSSSSSLSNELDVAMDIENRETNAVDELENKDGRDKCEKIVENAKEVEKGEEENVAEIIKKDKSDCELLVNFDSTSSSKCNPVSNSACNILQEDLKKDSNENEEEGKQENDIDNDSIQLYDNDICNNLESDTTLTKEDKKASDNTVEEQKSIKDDTKKRVLRARDKTKGKFEKGQGSCKDQKETVSKLKMEEEEKPENSNKEEEDSKDLEEKVQESMTEDTDDTQNSGEMDANDVEPQARGKRSREAKKRKEDQLNMLKNKRAKREIRRCDQQNKEETLLDNEVAKINENNRSFLNKYENGVECATNFRGFSEGGRDSLEKHEKTADNVRSKSENDLIIAKENGRKTCENRLSRNLSENHVTKEVENIDILDVDCKPIKTPETSQKDSDETSTSGESSSSVNITSKILETPEDKAKKESILRLLGLESLEKAAERLNHQKAKKGQSTGTLKTVIRVQKEREKDKRRSRSPLKMVLKQGRGDGEGDSPENFYTIQKEVSLRKIYL